MICPPILQRTGERLAPMGLEVTLATDALPTAKISLAEDPGVQVHDLLEIFTAQGSAGLFRVTDRAKTYGDEITLDARGALDTLSDDIYPGEDTLTGTPAAVLADILSHQSTARWQLGNVAMTGTVKIRNSYTNLFDLAEAVRTDKTGYWWMFDFSTIPWTVSLAALPTDTAAEFRLGRNVASAKIDLSDSELFTRLYMTVSTDSASTLYTYNNTAAQATWGVISRTIDVDADEVTDPAATGAAILAEHAQPVAFITLDGYDLKRLTGDNFDRITLGSLCRVVLPDFEATFSERVTRITWPDALTEPERITVSLANNLTPFDDQLKLIKKTGGGTARQVAEQERELVRHETSIDQNNDRILLWATASEWDAIAQQYQTYQRSEFSIMSDQIGLVVTGVGANATVNTASIVLAINGGTGHSSAKIEADQILLEGNTTLKGSLDIVGGELHSTYPISTTSYLKGSSLTISDTNGTASLTSTNIKNTFVSAKVTNSDTLTVKKQDNTTAFTIEKSGSSLVISDGTGTITFSGAAAGWASAAAAVVWPSAGTSTSFGVTVPASTENTTTSKTFTLSSSGNYCICSDGTNTVARWNRTGQITAASPTTTQPSSGNNLRTISVSAGSLPTYVKLSASGYRAASNNDYITIKVV